MTHVFVSPHPDDVALSCEGLIASLRDHGEAVTIVSVFSGAGDLESLTPFQRLALGFGSPEKRRAGDTDLLPEDDDSGAVAIAAADAMAVRRAEDEAFARFVGAANVFVDLPDAVFRGYGNDSQLMGPPRPDDSPPVEELRRALARLGPALLYLPLAMGGHVDHRQARRAAMTLLAEAGSPFRDRTRFYEDFPYALNVGFELPDQLDPEIFASLPPGVSPADVPKPARPPLRRGRWMSQAGRARPSATGGSRPADRHRKEQAPPLRPWRRPAVSGPSGGQRPARPGASG